MSDYKLLLAIVLMFPWIIGAAVLVLRVTYILLFEPVMNPRRAETRDLSRNWYEWFF